MSRPNPANTLATVLLSALLTALIAFFFPVSGTDAAHGNEFPSLMAALNSRQLQNPDAQGQVPTTNSGRGLGEILRTDGTLDLASGFRGSLDARGYRLVSGTSEAPRFEPVAATGDEHWAKEFYLEEMDDYVFALVVDGSGNLYAGGQFSTAGGVTVNGVAKWNGSSWEAFGSGLGDDDWSACVNALAVDGSGNLYAGGYFVTMDGVSVNHVAKWNGSSWEALGSGMNGSVNALAVDGSGKLFAVGLFSTAGGVSADGMAKWNGTSWEALGIGSGGHALARDSNGNVYTIGAGGFFKWNGTSWETLGLSNCGIVFALVVDGNGNVYAGGSLGVSKWNGTSWEVLGSGMDDYVFALAVDGSGNVYAGGNFTTAGGVSAKLLAKWNGSSWEALGSGMLGQRVSALAVDGSNTLFVGGYFGTAGGFSAHYIAAWRDGAWLKAYFGPTNGLTGFTVWSLAVDGVGNVYAGGDFTSVGEIAANSIAKWNGSSWEALGSGLSYGMHNTQVYAVAVDGSGNVYAGGNFLKAGGIWANYVAKWNGSSWEALGSGVDDEGGDACVKSLAVDSSGNVYAGGRFTTAGEVVANHVAKWNGSSWEALGSGIDHWWDPMVDALAVDNKGNVFAGGLFNKAGKVSAANIAKWNGSSWEALAGKMSDIYSDCQVSALTVDSAGNVYAGGVFQTVDGISANYIAKWNGSSWEALGSGIDLGLYSKVNALAVDFSGNVYAGGRFETAGGVSVNRIAKWDGSSWQPLGSGMNSTVHALAVDGDGNVYAGGYFEKAGGKVSLHFARWTETPALGHSLSGTVTSGGIGLAGVMVSLTQAPLELGGAAGKSTTTDSNGNYSFSGIPDGTYLITPSKAGYSFSPAGITAEVAGADVGAQDFAAAFTGYSVSGKVTNGSTGLAGVTINLTGAATQTTTSGSDGTYSFTGLFNGSYLVTPGKAGCSFFPESQSFNISGADVTGLDFALAEGALKVTLTPGGAVNAGARWRVDSGTWKKSGATVTKLGIGSHTVTFKVVHGWVTPAARTVTIEAGKTTLATALYEMVGADFTGTPISGKPSLKVKFTDQSTGPVKGWYWDFGDNSTSKVQNPLHTYSKPGTYTVSLTVKNGSCINTTSKTDYITIYPVPKADFSGTPTSGKKPLSVQFTDLTDQSSGPVTSWLWRFGDGTTSTEHNPTHIYTRVGSYKVKLTVKGPGGTNTMTKTGYIQVQK